MSEERGSLEPPLEPDFVDEFAERARPEPVTYRRSRGRRPSLFGPLLLIGIGVLLLLDQLGYLDLDFWALLGHYWPVILILIGLDLLLGRRSAIGGILGALVPLVLIGGVLWLVFGGVLPGRISFENDSRLTRESVEYPLGDLKEADVFLDLGSWQTVLRSLDASENLIEGEISTYGVVEFNASERGSLAEISLSTRAPSGGDLFSWRSSNDDHWRIRLSPDVTLDLELDCGSGGGEYDLRDLDLRKLVLDGGSGSFDLSLPADRGMNVHLDVGSGSMQLVLPERGEGELTIDGGTGGILIELPEGMAARVEIESGSGAFLPLRRLKLVEGERDGDGVWESEDYDHAENRFDIRIEQGSGMVRIESQ